MKYTVRLHLKFPAWDERNGAIHTEVEADSKKQAVKLGRRDFDNAGHLVGRPVTEYSIVATPAEQQEVS